MQNKQPSAFRRFYQRLPFFTQCMLSYLLIMTIFVTALFFISNKAKGIARQSYLNERSYSLETSSQEFYNQAESFHAIPLAMGHTPYYGQLRLLKKAEILPKHYYAAAYTQRTFSEATALISSDVNCFVYFMNSDLLISKHTVSFESRNFFENSMTFSNLPASEFHDLLQNFDTYQIILPQQTVYGAYVDSASYITVLYRSAHESAVYGMLIRDRVLDSLYRLDELPEGTRLTMTNGDGELIYSNIPAPDHEDEFEHLFSDVSALGIQVKLSIPSDYFSQLTAPLSSVMRTCILVASISGMILSVLLSLFSQLPLRRLLRISSPENSPSPVKNEFMALSNNIQQYKEENFQLRCQIDEHKADLRISLLSWLLAQDSCTARDEALAAEYLPQAESACRIVCLQIIPDDENARLSDFISFHAKKSVETLFAGSGAMVQMREDLFALLIPESDDIFDFITEASSALQAGLTNYGITLAVGISESFLKVEFIHEAYLHAQFSLRPFQPPLSPFQPGDQKEPFRFIDLSRFQSMVLGCEETAALTLLDQLLSTAEQTPWLPAVLGFILDSISSEMHLGQDDSHMPLRQRTSAVIQALNEQKEDHSSSLFDTILTYLNEAYADSSLSADSISGHFGISKSYLYRTFRDSIHMTPSEMLEQIRMDHANQLLLSTRMSVNAVAAACGYNSSNTFYKAYKKRFNCSPNTSRSSSSDAPDTPDAADDAGSNANETTED